MKRKNLTQGPIFKTLLLYSIPIIVSNVVQLFFHIADVTVLSFMTNDAAVAAVGACGSIITLLVSLFTGFSAGANVLVSKLAGKGDEDGVKKATGTALLIALCSGLILMTAAVIFAKDILTLTNCQPDVLDMATTYMRIYFLGMPVTMLYNFSTAILTATGDSTRPMVYINISGVLNIILNVTFISVFNLTVEGVALATVLSNLIALILILIRMMQKNCICKIQPKYLRFGKNEFLEIVRIGVPTCLCGIFFYVANVILSSCVNAMSTDAMTANAISSQFDGIIYTVGYSIAVATAAVIGQCFGAKKLDRIKATLKVSVLYVSAVCFSLGVIFVIISKPLLSLMTESESVIAIAMDRMTLLCLTYFFTSIMEVFAFSLRSLGHQNTTLFVGAICGFGVRTIWALVIWPMNKTLSMLFACYAISAIIATIIYIFVYLKALKKLKVEFTPQEISDSQPL